MTDLAIVESRADRASVHICDHLREVGDWTERTDNSRADADGGATYYQTDGIELRTFEEFHLELEHPVDVFDCDPDLLVFASRHAGDTDALLTGHFTGNFGPAEFGGEDHAVAEACPNALARLLEAFDEYAPEEYDVGMECTHHGPTDVGCPSLFAELGSGDEQWDDPAGAEAVARGILELRDVAPHSTQQVVGFGGNHYAPRFERIVRETPWAVGHIAADWGLEELGHPSAHRDLLEAVFEASNTNIAVIDGDWPVLEETLTDLDYQLVSETWLREVGNRPLEHVDQLEDASRALTRGFGSVSTTTTPSTSSRFRRSHRHGRGNRSRARSRRRRGPDNRVHDRQRRQPRRLTVRRARRRPTRDETRAARGPRCSIEREIRHRPDHGRRSHRDGDRVRPRTRRNRRDSRGAKVRCIGRWRVDYG